MAKFQYEALDTKTGRTEKGELPANSQAEALARLQEMGLAPTKCEEAKAEPKKGKGKAKKKGKKGKKGAMQLEINIGAAVNEKTLTIFTRQLAQLTSAGLPLLSGLTVLARQEKNQTLKRVLGELAEVIEGGGTFSEGLAQHPKVFNKLFVSMVKAGELGGVLEVVLDRLAQFMEKAMRIKGKVKAAMFYPIAVLIVAIVIMAILLIFVIPKFKDVFGDLTGEDGLPDFTQFVLDISDTVKENAFGTATGMFAFMLTLSLCGKSKHGRFVLDKLALFFPIIGPVVEKVSIARFARTLGTLINSGVPILQALNIVKDTSGNTVVAQAVQDVHDSVKEGETIVAPLEASRVFPPMVISMVDVGEKTGDMPQMLEKIADTYDEEVDRAVESMTSLIEPVMIVFLAVIVGSIVIAMFLPLIKMIESIS